MNNMGVLFLPAALGGAAAGLIARRRRQAAEAEALAVEKREQRERAAEETARLEAREDSAIQRSVTDAQKAGLSGHSILGSIRAASTSKFTPDEKEPEESDDPLRRLLPLLLLTLARRL